MKALRSDSNSLIAALLGITLFASASAYAEEAPTADSTAWKLELHLAKAFDSPLGELALRLIEEEAPDKLAALDEFVNALGFDPRTDVRELVLFGDNFEQTSGTGLISIGESRGNLEGWILAAPGYESEEINSDLLLHSFLAPELKDARLWCALPFSPSEEGYVFIISFDRNRTLDLTRQVIDQGLRDFGEGLTENRVLSVWVNDLQQVPFEVDERDPGSAVIKTLQSVALHAETAADQLHAVCEVNTDSAARARQVHQLIQGLKAMVQLAATSDDHDAQRAGEVIRNLAVEYEEGETEVTARYAIGYDTLEEILRKRKDPAETSAE